MRLIDADEVDKQAMYGHILYADGTENLGYTRLVLGIVIKDAPTIEAEPVKHGHWERYDMDIAEHPYHCSYCGWSNHHISNRHVDEFKVCPECGARMDEVRE